jgi:hypothetical protein
MEPVCNRQARKFEVRNKSRLKYRSTFSLPCSGFSVHGVPGSPGNPSSLRHSFFREFTRMSANGLKPHVLQINAISNPPSPAMKTDSVGRAQRDFATEAQKQLDYLHTRH